MEKIWIIGAGQFGLRAAKWLMKQRRSVEILMVDLDAAFLAEAEQLGCRIEMRDGVKFLFDNLNVEHSPDWVIPAVPVHLASEWCRLHIGEAFMRSMELPAKIKEGLPNAMDGPSGDIYVSHADFICPPNCNEPDERCTQTGRPRKPDMFELLAQIRFQDIKPFVIQSEQLGPGVGGYRPNALFELKKQLEVYRGPCFTATACRCHGVISGSLRR
ncbi:MAG: potassium transporter [Desulfobacterales bacterium]|nr:MAG: potassium transporter [Desulfobacterales bacterium]